MKIMEHYREENNCWMKFRAMEFLVNFLKNHNKDIDNEDIFSVIGYACTQAQLVWEFRNFFSPIKRRTFKNSYRRRRNEVLDFKTSPQEFLRNIWNLNLARSKILEFIEHVVRKTVAAQAPAALRPEKKWTELVKMMQLDTFEENILLIARCVCHDILCEYCVSGRSNADDAIDFIAKCLDCPKEKVADAVSENSRLRRYDCVDDDLDFRYRLEDFFSGIQTDPLSSSYYQKMKKAALPWDFYGELAQTHGTLLKKLLRAGKPVNILLYGAPGTGKTSFARSLAAELKLECYNIAQSSSDYGRNNRSDSSPEFRFAALQICDNSIVNEKSVIIVDEADEMLLGNHFSAFQNYSAPNEKSRLNALLDTLKTPVIWITNCPAYALDESSRRRFDYSIKFEPLNAAQRLAIWKNNVSRMKLKKYFTDELLEGLANDYPISAGGITQALKNLALFSPAGNEVEEVVRKLIGIHCKLMDIDCKADEKLLPARDYSLAGLNIKGDIKLEMIVGAVRKFINDSGSASPDRPRMNLLLSGPPGTGKTEFVKFLAKEVDKKIHVCMGSDLLNMYVGGTEQNIKNAFARAEAENAILFLDEIDGMVQNRERSNHSWEVTQVNELLHRMENFNGVMIGATNFFKNLDPAIMRRFTFKLDFNYLDNEGKKIFFERMFKCSLTPAEVRRLNAIPNLAPGDFRTVRQALYYLDSSSNALRLESLEKESAAKPATSPCTSAGRFGF